MMSERLLRQDSLVLYKARPARVRRVGKKLEIELEQGETLSVRPKDVLVLHPGPVQDLHELRIETGEVETAWELLAGETITLPELAELAYGKYTPGTAWAAWQLMEDGLYFHGEPQEVVARNPEELAQERAAREARRAEEQEREAFLERVHAGQIVPDDGRHLREVEDLALARTPKSRLLRELGRAESPENAHALLLELGYWDRSLDPYPQRLGLPTLPPEVELPDLPREERVDLTHLSALAIDDEGNQEPDDALSRDGDRLWVHVADGAALVPPGSAADLEARARGATLYLPEGAIPMLPWEAIQRLGLGLAEVSPALSFGLDLDASGEIEGVEVVASWVKVTRLTYEEADARLEEEPLRGLYKLSETFRARREAHGAISIDLPEVMIRVESDKVIICPLPSLRSRELVTEAMLVAGEAIARFAFEQNIPLPFTTQDPPEMDERPADLAGMYGLRRSLKPSQQSGIPGSHAGLGLEVYTQATSPLRRYLDLVVHQQLRAHLRGEELLAAHEVLERIGATSAVAGTVNQAERLARRHWTLVYLMQHPGWRGEGIVVDKRRRQNTVLIPELDLEPRVHLRQDLPLNSRVSLLLREVRLAALEAHFGAIEIP
jgi:exoribonuclease-2